MNRGWLLEQRYFPSQNCSKTKQRRGKGTSGHQKIRPLLLRTLFSILQLLPCLFWEGLCTVVVQLNILEMTDTCSDTSSKKRAWGKCKRLATGPVTCCVFLCFCWSVCRTTCHILSPLIPPVKIGIFTEFHQSFPEDLEFHNRQSSIAWAKDIQRSQRHRTRIQKIDTIILTIYWLYDYVISISLRTSSKQPPGSHTSRSHGSQVADPEMRAPNY